MNIYQIYQSKKGTTADALAMVRSGDVIVLGGVANCPQEFGKALHTQSDRLEGVRVFKDRDNPFPFVEMPGMAGHINSYSFFFSNNMIIGNALGNSSYVPSDLWNYVRFLTECNKISIVALAVSPMDGNGNFAVGLSNMWEGDVLEAVRGSDTRIILEVNPRLPYVTGAPLVHVSEVSLITEVDYKPVTFPLFTAGGDEYKVAENVRSLMRDGDCVQFGIGSLPDSIAAKCMDLKDLGLHTEMLTTALGEMIRRGVITGERKNFNKGEHIFTFAGGDEALFRTVAENPACRIVPASYGVNPFMIMQNDNMVSVNTLIEMDLTGQICSETIGTKQYSGSGGAFDYALGALMSKGGRGIMAFTSRTAKGYSKIKATLTPGAAVTVGRNYADYIVTEYGIAHLRGRTVRERAMSLISIAHPDFREELRDQARKNLWI